MDNKFFNVNGESEEFLLKALELVFIQNAPYDQINKERPICTGWVFDKDFGLVLLWSITYEWNDKRGYNKFPADMTAKDCLPFVVKWLKSDEAKTVPLADWEKYADHDGCNHTGWRVYLENWGHIGNHTTAICAIKSVALWFGK